MTERGMSLVEILVAVLILSVGALALAQLFVAGIAINARTKDDTQISTVAQQQLETLIEQGYSGNPVGGDLNSQVTDYFLDDVVLEGSSVASDSSVYHQNNVKYDVFWQVTEETPAVTGVLSRSVSVRVVSNRMEMGATQREVTVSTFLTRPFGVF